MAGTSPAMTPDSPRPLILRRLVAVMPPGFGNTAEIAWLFRRPAEHVPIGDPVGRLVPMRDPIAPGAYHAVERAAGGYQLWSRRRGDAGVDQRIDRRIGHAGEIVGAFQRRGLRGKI